MTLTIRGLALAAALAPEQCYESPDELTPEQVLQLGVKIRKEATDEMDTMGEMNKMDEMDEMDVCEAGEVAADGIGVVDLTVDFPGKSRKAIDVVLTTSLGVLDPGKTTDAERRRLTLKTSGVGPLTTPLYVGLESGTALLSASVGDVRVDRSLCLVPSLPTSLALSANVHALNLAEGKTASDLVVNLFADDNKRPSTGIDVALLACEDNATSDKVELLPRLRTGTDPTQVGTRLTVNALGLAELQTVATSGKSKTEITVHAWVGDAALTCETPAGMLPSAHDTLQLELHRKPM